MDNVPSVRTRDNRCLIDAFTCTFQNLTPEKLVEEVLKLDSTLWQRNEIGRYLYKKSFAFGAIQIHYDGKIPNMGICLEMTGQGCLELVQLTQNDSIFFDILSNNVASSTRLTRIDIAIDDFKSLLLMDTIVEKIKKKEIRTRSHTITECKGLNGTEGHTVYIGAASSESRIRIYDKQAESKTNYPWIRVELILRHTMARSFQRLILEAMTPFTENRNHEIAKLGVSVIRDKLCFIEMDDSNRSRCPVTSWWQEFLDTAPLHLSVDKQRIPSIEQASAWLKKQVFPSLVTLLCLLGVEWFDTLLVEASHRIDDARALTWMQQMHSLGMSASIDPRSDALVEDIQRMLGDYYQAK